MAGASARASGIVPWARSSSAQPATDPGIVTVSGPCSGSVVTPRAASASASARAPARPLEFNAVRLPVFPSRTSAKRSPPTPVIVGSTTASVAAAVTAASTALPPSCRTWRPAADASGWLVAMTPCVARTGDRVP